MASADSEADRDEANARGYRTFRIRTGAVLPGEIVCPASDEGGHRVQCDACGICNGTQGKFKRDVTIIAHGTGKRFFSLAPVA